MKFRSRYLVYRLIHVRTAWIPTYTENSYKGLWHHIHVTCPLNQISMPHSSASKMPMPFSIQHLKDVTCNEKCKQTLVDSSASRFILLEFGIFSEVLFYLQKKVLDALAGDGSLHLICHCYPHLHFPIISVSLPPLVHIPWSGMHPWSVHSKKSMPSQMFNWGVTSNFYLRGGNNSVLL